MPIASAEENQAATMSGDAQRAADVTNELGWQAMR
jgi:hypothetical protein